MSVTRKQGLTIIRRKNYKEYSDKWKQNLVVVVVIFLSNQIKVRLSWVELMLSWSFDNSYIEQMSGKKLGEKREGKRRQLILTA